MSANDNLALWRRLSAVAAVGLIAAACGAEVDTDGQPICQPICQRDSLNAQRPYRPA